MFGLSSIGIGAGQSLAGAAGAFASGGYLAPMLSTAAMFGEGIANNYWNYKNYQLQKGQYGYEQYLQALLMGREDNAVQRRMADLRAAGLNPVLAAGQAAQAGPVVSTQPPQMSKISGMTEAAQSALGLLSMQANISKTIAEEKYTLQQEVKSQEERNLIREQLKQVQAQTQSIKTGTAEKWWNLKQAQDFGVRTNTSGLVGQFVDTVSHIKNKMLRKAETAQERKSREEQVKKLQDQYKKTGTVPVGGYTRSMNGLNNLIWSEK